MSGTNPRGEKEPSQLRLIVEASVIAVLALAGIYLVRFVSSGFAEITHSPDVLASRWSWDWTPSEIAEGLFIAVLTVIGYLTILVAAICRLWAIVKALVRRGSGP